MSIRSKYKQFKKLYLQIFRHKDKIDIGQDIKLPLRTKLKYNWLGFTDRDYVAFDLENNDYHQYISYWERLGLESINGRFGSIVGEKVLFERLFGSVVHVPHVYCWIKKKTCIDPNTGKIVDVLQVIREQGQVIVKPTRSNGGGAGIHLISFKEQEYCFDGVKFGEEKVKEKIESLEDYIIVQFIQQAKYSSEIFPHTANSIRIATGRWKDGHVSLLFAFHRFGSSTTGAVDNMSSGGIFAFVDENGILSKGKHYSDLKEELDVHPDTGAQIEGTAIPDWNSLKTLFINAHQRLPYFTFLAWDVVIDKNNVAYALEVNKGSDLEFQAVKPMRHEIMGKFMKEYELLSPRVDR